LPPAAAQAPVAFGPFGPEDLARAVRAVAAELERDPVLAHRLAELLRELALPAPDPEGSEGPDGTARRSPGSSRRRHATHAGARTERASQKTASPSLDAAPDTPPPSTRAWHPRVIAGASAELGPGIPDPFALRARLGEDGLRAVLADLRLGSLRAIVREHRLDPDATAVRGNDAQKLRALILDRTRD
jgi:hypothetical protein